MAIDDEPSVKQPMSEFVRGIAIEAGRAGAREVVAELDILPRLDRVEKNNIDLRIAKAKMYGVIIGISAAVGVLIRFLL